MSLDTCSQCKHFRPIFSSTGICLKGHGYKHQTAQGLPHPQKGTGYVQYYGRVCENDYERMEEIPPAKSRWVTGITLKRYFQFTEHQMRKLRKEVGKAPPMNGKWLYDLDKVQVNHKPKTAIPEHLITERE